MPNCVSRRSARSSSAACVVERDGREVEHRQLHAAGDVDADAVGDDGALGREHAADRQAVAAVRVGHQRALHGRGQPQGVVHLRERAVLGVGAPRLHRRGRRPLAECDRDRGLLGEQLLGDPGEEGVARVLGRRGHDGLQLGQRPSRPRRLTAFGSTFRATPTAGPAREPDRSQIVSADARHGSIVGHRRAG